MTRVSVDSWDLVHLLLSIEDRPRGEADARALAAVARRAVAALDGAPPAPLIEVPEAWTAPLHVEGVPGWVMATNSWVLAAGGRAVVVDVPPEPARLLARLEALGVEPVAVVLTHGHLDHAGGVAAFLRATGALPVHVAAGDLPAVLDPRSGGALAALVDGVEAPPPAALLPHRPLRLGSVRLRPLATPGHTPGSTCVLVEGAARALALTGDTVFAGGGGRSDLAGGQAPVAERSRQRLLARLPGAAVLLPGHGAATTVASERPAAGGRSGAGTKGGAEAGDADAAA